MSTPPCLDCVSFYVTWDSRYPRGCRTYGIMSRDLPSQVVLRETGVPCMAFQMSPRLKTKDAPR